MTKKKTLVIKKRFLNTINDYLKASDCSMETLAEKVGMSKYHAKDIVAGASIERSVHEKIRKIVGPDRLTVVTKTLLETIKALRMYFEESNTELSRRIGAHDSFIGNVVGGFSKRIETRYDKKLSDLFIQEFEEECKEAEKKKNQPSKSLKGRVKICNRLKNTIEDYQKTNKVTNCALSAQIGMGSCYIGDIFNGKVKTLSREMIDKIRAIVGPDRLTVVNEALIHMIETLKSHYNESYEQLSVRLMAPKRWAGNACCGGVKRIETRYYDKLVALYASIDDDNKELSEIWEEPVSSTVSIGQDTTEEDKKEMRKRGKKKTSKKKPIKTKDKEMMSELPSGCIQFFVQCMDCGSDLVCSWEDSFIHVVPCRTCLDKASREASETAVYELSKKKESEVSDRIAEMKDKMVAEFKTAIEEIGK